jgi:hypothetical protein
MSDRSSGVSDADMSVVNEWDGDESLEPEELHESGSSGGSVSSGLYVSDVDWSTGRCRGCDGQGPLGMQCTECRSTRAVKFQYEAYLGVCGNCERVGKLGSVCECSGLVLHEFHPYSG